MLTCIEYRQNVHLWWAMQEKFDKELDQLDRESATTPASQKEDNAAKKEDAEDAAEEEFVARKKVLTAASKKAKLELETDNDERRKELQAEVLFYEYSM
jgi:hypothetical protein